MSAAYYNEIDEFAAEWLRRLILFGHIAPGDVNAQVTAGFLEAVMECRP